jgi:hypothetical protein
MIALKPLSRILTAVLCMCLVNTLCSAQGKAKEQWGKIGPADFAVPAGSSALVTGSSAVILSDQGFVNFVGNNNGWFSHVYKRHTRIKILDKKALEMATVAVLFYAAGDNPEKITDIQAAAYNLENGQVVPTRLESKDIFDNRLDKEYSEKKFSIPGVKMGSIIEYSYTITSDYSLPSWHFQWVETPCLYSEFQVEIPQTMYYVFVRQGVHPFAVDKGSEGYFNYTVKEKGEGALASVDRNLSVSTPTVKHDWVMKDVPAFGSERYLSTPANYIDKIDFQLSKIYDGQEYHDRSNNWANATETLLSREDFGQPLDADNYWLDASLGKITAGTNGPLEEARAIYYYVSRHFTCTDHEDPYIKTNLRDVMKKNSGTVGDVNLLLVSMLRRRNMDADPVLLSTREHGFNLASYPILQRLNYVIARLNIAGHVYYLDAAHPELGFGQLAGNCYNGHARVISKKDSCSLWFWADSLKESKITMVIINNTDKGMEGQWQSTLGNQESYEVRRVVTGGGEEKFFKDIQTAYGNDIEISAGGIDSLDQPENPVKVHYEFALKGASTETMLYLNPIMGDGWHENPFKAVTRKYPVEMPYATDETYVLSMDIPKGFSVDELPKSTRVAYNGDQGSFEYLVQQSADQIQLRCRLKLNKAAFQPEDYSSLRDFFAYVVKKENEQIVLKKK